MTTKRTYRSYPRSVALIVGTLIMLIGGVVYAWSIYSVPFRDGFGWTSAQLGVCFTVLLGCFCLGGVIGGAIASRWGVGVSIPSGGLLGFIGFGLCLFLNADRLWLLYLAFGISGIGVGFIYNGVISAVVPRFPDKKGLASGILLMGYGASTLVLGSLAAQLIASPSFGWHLTYLLTGVLILLAGILGRIFIMPPAVESNSAGAKPVEGLTTAQMVRTSRFWLFFVFATIGTAFGSGLIAHGNYLFQEGGAAAATASLAVGLVSVMNGLGRVFFGMVHDRYGFRVSLLADALLYIVAGIIAVFALRSQTSAVLIGAMMLIGACYGAVPTISTSVVGEFFGQAHYGLNLSVLNLNILVGSFASTIIGAMETASGSYSSAIILFTALEAVALIPLFILMKVVPKSK